MTTAATGLPLCETLSPDTASGVSDALRRAKDQSTPVYPLGGGTCAGFGLAPRVEGLGLSLDNMARLIDYPHRDMTITVEAGMTVAALDAQLAAHQQRLPLDVPRADRATIGGLIATGYCGPRRYGYGQVRDYVIGIQAVDGRGVAFKAGGRVVKNVAGYDFCKLLSGSLGTLAVITQVTFKLRPRVEQTALVVCDIPDLAAGEPLLAALVTTDTTPVAIEMLAGPAWSSDPVLSAGSSESQVAARLVVGFEGPESEVAWQVERLHGEWNSQPVTNIRTVRGADAAGLWTRLIDADAGDDGAPLVVKFGVRPRAVCDMMQLLAQVDPDVSIVAHAGNGIVLGRFERFTSADAARVLIQRLQPAALAAGGHCVVWSSTLGDELTRQAVWGPSRSDLALMRAVKNQFDPHGLLNPGRYYV